MFKPTLLGLAFACLSFAQGVDQNFLNMLKNRYKPEPMQFNIGLMGDQHYGAVGIARWPALAASINADKSLKFTVHVGDIKNGSTVCSDAHFQRVLTDLQNMEAPLIYTPGDNEWTDCHRANNGSMDPMERLQTIRNMFFPDDNTLGKQKMPLVRQTGYPGYSLYKENAIWAMGNVVFVSIHSVGSSNNFGRTLAMDQEATARNTANLWWLRTAFALARDNNFGGVMILMQADPKFEDPNNLDRYGHEYELYVIEQETLTFGRPVVMVHGDNHYYREDKPMVGSLSGKRIEWFTRVEVPGSADVHWVKAEIDPRHPNLFRFDPVVVVENLDQHPIP